MVEFLLAVFTVSVVGLVVLLVFKHLELQTGKTLFLPVWLRSRDAAIQRATQHLFRRTTIRCIKCIRVMWQILQRGKNIPKKLGTMRTKRYINKTEHNGGESMYLKQVMEHKNNLRSEGRESE